MSIVVQNVAEANAIPLSFYFSVFSQLYGPPMVAAPTPAEAWRLTAEAAAMGAWRSCLSLVPREQRSRRSCWTTAFTWLNMFNPKRHSAQLSVKVLGKALKTAPELPKRYEMRVVFFSCFQCDKTLKQDAGVLKVTP